MEFMAWFSHKYIMHGFLWSIHKDHHIKDHKSWFERNDLFFIFYALVSSGFVVLWGEMNFWFGLPIALGIFLYGFILLLFTELAVRYTGISKIILIIFNLLPLITTVIFYIFLSYYFSKETIKS